MIAQTISLFRYLMLGILGNRLYALVAILCLVAALAGSFIGELSMINAQAIVAAFVADFLRYSLALLLLLVIATSVAEDYEFRQFDRLLTMPLSRWQYIAAQALLIACLGLMVVLPAWLLVWLHSSFELSLYWAAALWLELFLLGLLGLLAAISLEKIPLAVFFSITVYLLAKLSGLITLIVAESVKMADGSATSRVVEFVFTSILYVIPGVGSFADSDVFFAGGDLLARLGDQVVSVSIYAGFLVGVGLVEFYRKEFNI